MDGPLALRRYYGLRVFGHDELERLERLRRRCQQEPQVFTARELASLRFVRWLVQTGRLDG